jgi:ankyrin repeat protein
LLLELKLVAHKPQLAVARRLGRNALHWAAHRGHEAAVEALLYAGADAEAAEAGGCLQLTPLHLAIKRGHVAAARALLYARSDRFLVRRQLALPYSDEKVANREIRVWHGATKNGLERWTNPKPLRTIVYRAAI